jgi:addiction module RelE/StbE family toxin
MLNIRYSRRAVAHLASAYEYIYKDSPNCARQVIERIKTGISMLCIYPESGKKGRKDGTRELVVSKAPFVIVYRVLQGYIEIVAILHTSRQYPL